MEVGWCGRVRIPGWKFLFSALTLSLPAPYSGKCRKLWAGLAAWSGPAPRPKSTTSPAGAAQVIHYQRLLKEESTQGTYVDFRTFFDTYIVQPNGQEHVHRRVPVCAVQKAINKIQYDINLGNSIFKYWTGNVDAKWNYITHHRAWDYTKQSTSEDFGRPTDQVKNKTVIPSIPNQTCSILTICISNFGNEGEREVVSIYHSSCFHFIALVLQQICSSTSSLASNGATTTGGVSVPLWRSPAYLTWDSIVHANL
ncbi:hypothetical protein GE21DRAFT_1308027 [Neurospora crassa]|nr:hypothetical protein GE21DRAFT_1308027 [Neurospora crassa]